MNIKILNIVTLLCLLAVPNLASAATTTKWTAKVDFNQQKVATGRLYLCVDGCPQDPERLGAEFMIKGMGYSPTPIGVNPDDLRALSDYFWDVVPHDPLSSATDKVTHNYEFLWKSSGKTWNGDAYRADLRKISATHKANAIRVYGLTSLLAPVYLNPVSGQYEPKYDINDPNVVTITHKAFLDEAQKEGIYVMVGLFLDDLFWSREKFNDPANQKLLEWWDASYKGVVKEIGAHPAVMGFIINNESADNFIGMSDADIEFFWNQMRTISKNIKTLAPDKLVGEAFHNFPDTLWKIQSQMANTPHIDFWGYNVYGVTSLDLHSYMMTQPTPGNKSMGYQYFSNTYPDSAKPVLFTEWGQPVTTHTESGSSNAANLTITDAPAEVSLAVAKMVQDWGNDLYSNKYPIFGGGFYFEFSDEWWKGNSEARWSNPANQSSRFFYWYGGTPDPGRPGKYDDETAFGLYGLKPHVKNTTIPYDTWIAWNSYYGPSYLFDSLIPGVRAPDVRQPVEDNLVKIYSTNFASPGLRRRLSAAHKLEIGSFNSYVKIDKKKDGFVK